MLFMTCLIYFLSFQGVCCQDYFAFHSCFSDNVPDFSYSEDYFETISHSSYDWYSDQGRIVFYETDNNAFHLCSAVHLCNSTGDPPVCSCEPSCIVFKTCCYDAPILRNHSVPGWQSAALLDEWKEEYFICVETFSPLRGHHMIGVCPPFWQDDVIRSKCEDVSTFLKEKENLDLTDPLSLTPVVGAGNVTFRNAFCAICHSVDGMTLRAWEMEILCPESVFAMFTRDESRGLTNLGSDCKVRLKPPEWVTHLARLPCFPRQTTAQCNADKSHDIKLVEECETYLAPICVSDGVVYKNPQCVLCNYEKNTYPLGFRGLYCLELNELLGVQDPSSQSNLIPGRTQRIVPLSVVFDFSSQSGVRLQSEDFVYEEKKLPCNRGQVFDPFQGSCITFSCTEGYRFSDGECTPANGGGNVCSKTDSTPHGIITISFLLSPQNTLDMVKQYAQLCITDLLAMPFNSLYSRDILSVLPLINSSSLSQQPRSILNVEFNVNFTSTNVHFLLDNLLAFQSVHRSTTFLSSEIHGNESIAMKQVCDAVWSIRFEYGCENITKLECPTGWTIESEWSVNVTNETALVYLPRSQRLMVLTDINLNVDISINGRSVTNFSSAAIYCKSLDCPSVTLNASLFDKVSRNGSSYLQHVSLGNFTVPQQSFELTTDGMVKICLSVFSKNGPDSDKEQESFFLYSQFHTYFSTIGLCLSVVCLWITLATYLIFPTLRKAVSNKLIITFCFMLSFAQILLLILALPTSLPIVCPLVAMTSHYSWLVTFLSTTLLGFDLNQAFAWSPMTHSQGDRRARFTKYLSICFGLPLCLVMPFAVIHFVFERDAPFNYGDHRACWISDPQWNFYVLGIPLAICMIFNLVFFLHTVYSINKTRNETAKMNNSGEGRSLQDFFVFLKISLQLGFTWSASFIANVTGSPVAWLIFIALNSLQGVLILTVLMFSTRVRKLWRQKLGFFSETSKETINGSTRTTSTSSAKNSRGDTKL